MKRIGHRIGLAALLLMGGIARAQEPTAPEQPAPSTSTADLELRVQELSEKQRQLEQRVQQQEAASQKAPDRTPAESPYDVLPPPSPETVGPDWSAPLAGYSRKNFFLRD